MPFALFRTLTRRWKIFQWRTFPDLRYLVANKLFENGNCSRKLNLFGDGGEEGDMTCDLHHAFMTLGLHFVIGHMTSVMTLS